MYFLIIDLGYIFPYFSACVVSRCFELHRALNIELQILKLLEAVKNCVLYFTPESSYFLCDDPQRSRTVLDQLSPPSFINKAISVADNQEAPRFAQESAGSSEGPATGRPGIGGSTIVIDSSPLP